MKQYKETQYYVTDDYRVYNSRTKRFLTAYPVLNGRSKTKKYLGLNLHINGKQTNVMYHRLLAEVYITNPDNLPQVNHIDGNPLNNSLDNLEWVSASRNNIHAITTGLRPTKLNQQKADQIRELIKQGVSAKEIMNLYNIKSTLFYRIKSNQSWVYTT
jgi:hypothetical protein